MKPLIILLYTRDRTFDRCVSEAFLGTGAIILISRTVRDALNIVCRRGNELDFAVMDFDGGCRGMTLLSAVHTCHQQLPILVTTSGNGKNATAVAYANGARICLSRPLDAAALATAIASLHTEHQSIAA